MAQTSGNRIRELRQARGITPTQIAFHAGRSEQAIFAYEKGTRTPPLDVARRIAAALGAPLADVFPEHSDDPDHDPLPSVA